MATASTPSPSKKYRKKSKMTQKNTAEVNRQVVSALEQIQTHIQNGYSHESFVRISRLLGSIHKYLKKEEVQLIEESWRDSYTDSCDSTELSRVLLGIRSRFES